MIKTVTMCGSMKFREKMAELAVMLELEKKYAVIQCVYTDKNLSRDDIEVLSRLHRRKIEISDAIYVVNVDGYIGDATRAEIEYARSLDKEILYLEPLCLSDSPATHHMRLHPEPFELIRSGKKTIELRLFDEKRQKIKTGDTLIFTSTADLSRHISAHVIALHIFADFNELYKALTLEKCGYTPDNISSASPADMEKYYSMEEQMIYGVVGIEIKLI